MIIGAAHIVASTQDFIPGHIAIEENRISALGPGIPPNADRVFPDGTVVPGFIDLQVNGAGGVDLLDCDAHAIAHLSSYLASTGTTGFLATLISAPAERIQDAVHALRQARLLGAECLGVHLEGPALSHLRKGAHDSQWLRSPTDPDVQRLYSATSPDLRMVTLAPELVGAEQLMDWLRRERVIMSLGHTDATYDQATDAFRRGVGMVTHLFNAMRAFHHRDPGVVGAAFDDQECVCGLIADGIHVHPAAVRLAYRVLGADRVALVTDSIAAAGMPPGTYTLGTRSVRLEAGDGPRLWDGTLAGSALRMDQAISNVVAWGGALRDAVRSGAAVPAALLGRTDRGTLATGLRADLCILGQDGHAMLTVVGGRIVYERRL